MSSAPARRRRKPLGKRAADDSGSLPAAYSHVGKTREPKITQTDHGCIIDHCELVCTMEGGPGFEGVSVECNPGLSDAFPWLSTVADGFQYYRFHRLQYKYVTRQGTDTTGSVIIAPEYEAGTSSPATEALLSTFFGCVEAAVWQSFPVECNIASAFAQGAKKLIRDTAIVGDAAERQLYDALSLHAYTVDTPSGAVGKLWVDYRVELFTPGRPVPQVLAPQGCMGFQGAVQTTNPAGQLLQFGTGGGGHAFVTDTPFSTIPGASLAADHVNLPAGRYAVTMAVTQTQPFSTYTVACRNAMIPQIHWTYGGNAGLGVSPLRLDTLWAGPGTFSDPWIDDEQDVFTYVAQMTEPGVMSFWVHYERQDTSDPAPILPGFTARMLIVQLPVVSSLGCATKGLVYSPGAKSRYAEKNSDATPAIESKDP